jgi:hypothetical protein
MSELIENAYFDWLCAKVKQDNTPNYLELFRILHTHVFVPYHSADENRVADAIELREFFLSDYQLDLSLANELDEQCSVFEVLVAFADKAAFQIEDMNEQEWFWQFITNLRLEDYRRASTSDRFVIIDILNRFVMRGYESNGDGGLFPLRRPKQDQREVEIWYQFCAYVEDNGLLYGLV